MSQLGPDFLHRPLPIPSSISFDAAARWIVSGLSFFAPTQVRRTLWRPIYVLERLGQDQSATLVEEAWSGERRISPVKPDTEAPIAVALEPARIFETDVDLPAAAIGGIIDAVSLRLDSLSPISPTEIVFDVGAPQKASEGRIRVPIAIARKDDIRRVEQRFQDNNLHAIGATPDKNGSLRFVFKRFPSGKGALNNLMLATFACIAGVSILSSSVAARIDREIAADEAYQADLIATLRQHKASTGWLTNGEIERAGISGDEMVKALDVLAKSLPKGGRLVKASFGDGAWTVEGFAPEKAAWPTHVSPQIMHSNRPGFQHFHAKIPLRETS